MEPAGQEPLPDILRKRQEPTGPTPPEGVEVGEFRQGSALSQWALARYLVGRVLAEKVGLALLVLVVVLLVLAVGAQWGLHSTLLSALLVIVAVGVALLRWVLLGLVRRLTGFAQYGPFEKRMSALVGASGDGVLAELGRVGLPDHTLTLPLLALRLARRSRRTQTVERLRHFDTERAVPKARLDELHLLVREAVGREHPPQPGATGR